MSKPGLVETPMTAAFKKGFLWTKPEVVAKKIVKAIDLKKDEVYVPAFWFWILLLIKLIPTWLFKKK